MQIRVIPHGLILRIDVVRKLLIYAHSQKRNSLIILDDGLKSLIYQNKAEKDEYISKAYSS